MISIQESDFIQGKLYFKWKERSEGKSIFPGETVPWEEEAGCLVLSLQHPRIDTTYRSASKQWSRGRMTLFSECLINQCLMACLRMQGLLNDPYVGIPYRDFGAGCFPDLTTQYSPGKCSDYPEKRFVSKYETCSLLPTEMRRSHLFVLFVCCPFYGVNYVIIYQGFSWLFRLY